MQLLRFPLLNKSFSLAVFALHVHESGFFLDIDAFIHSFHSQNRPLAVLRAAVLFVGIHLSNDTNLLTQESVFRDRAEQAMHSAISDSLSLHDYAQIVQANVLLAVHFASTRQSERARQYLGTAFAICRGNGYHNLPSPMPGQPNAYEIGEVIHAWWTVVALDKMWSIAFQRHAALDEATERDTTTSWPHELVVYQVRLDPHTRSPLTNIPSTQPQNVPPPDEPAYTIRGFLSDPSSPSTPRSVLEVETKAAILFAAASRLNSQDISRTSLLSLSFTSHLSLRIELHNGALQQYHITFTNLDRGIQSIVPITATPGRRQSWRDFLLTNSLVRVACIKLHYPGMFNPEAKESGDKCVNAALQVVHGIREARENIPEEYVNPILGVSGLFFASKFKGSWVCFEDVVGERLRSAHHGDEVEPSFFTQR